MKQSPLLTLFCLCERTTTFFQFQVISNTTVQKLAPRRFFNFEVLSCGAYSRCLEEGGGSLKVKIIIHLKSQIVLTASF